MSESPSPAGEAPPPPDDRVLVKAALAGDDSAFAEIVRRYERGLYNLSWRMVRNRETARDLTQDIFIRVHRSLGKYDPVYPFTSWVYRVGTNLCIDFIRRRKLDTVSLDAPVSVGDQETGTRDVADDSPDPGLETERSQRARIVGRALARLPENHRMMLVLRHQRDLSYDEISLILDVPLGTVKARIHRARAAFRKVLEEDCDLEEFMT